MRPAQGGVARVSEEEVRAIEGEIEGEIKGR